jgi:hypothetical protein
MKKMDGALLGRMVERLSISCNSLFCVSGLIRLVVVIIIPVLALKLFLFQGSITFDIFSHEGSRAWYKVLRYGP